MNERIQKLSEQAGEHAAANATGDWEVGLAYQDLFNKKFAELIVRECANVGERYADGNYEVYNQIMAHFGMEEE